MSKVLECKAEETIVCCGVDVGTILDNSDNIADVELICGSEEEARQKLQLLTDKAGEVASEPCKIVSQIEDQGDTVKLTAAFTFSCQAESLIFELALR